MLLNLQNYFTLEIIFLWLNYGILPLWIVLIFFPNLKINHIFISSIFVPILFSSIYIFAVYKLIINEENIFEIFNLYFGINELYTLFSNENFLLIFWIHFLGINLFLGSWVSKDALKYNIPKLFSGMTLIIIYFAGPVGLFLYWLIRIFYAKKIQIYD
tara:strand:+ start:91 stop:564 length:474 start_codon:yes stop_codon:yes gene_type:complete